ncbi:MAG: hypothetical protein IJL06_00695 [Kiritimatiellae bacterium]|nr:hypothetical protein [Kiritimatiellia bacterium]
MSEATAKMTIRLPEEDLLGAKRYASKHRLSLSGLVVRYFKRLRLEEADPLPAEIADVAGTLPRRLDVRRAYVAGMEAKHA